MSDDLHVYHDLRNDQTGGAGGQKSTEELQLHEQCLEFLNLSNQRFGGWEFEEDLIFSKKRCRLEVLVGQLEEDLKIPVITPGIS